jgi:hypothetical protein
MFLLNVSHWFFTHSKWYWNVYIGCPNQFLKSKANKFPDRENIPGRLLKECAVELGPAFQPLFKQSVDTGVMSTILV